ncbi:MAG TPA: hypothetical protein V6D02_06095 [Candidatus Obscuribacterales bacterium]
MQQFLSDPLPCPRCDRQGFVRCNDDVFQCVYCDYLKRLPDERWQPEGVWLLIVLGLGAFVLVTNIQ